MSDESFFQQLGKALETLQGAWKGSMEPPPSAPKPPTAPLFVVPGDKPSGMVQEGNIDIAHRPNVWNPETGNYSSVWSITIGVDGKTIVIPRIADNGRIMTVPEAIQQYKTTKKSLGVFANEKDAEAYSQNLHLQQQAQGTPQSPWGQIGSPAKGKK